MTKQELQDRIDEIIYENNVGAVTPTNLNDVLSDIVDSMVEADFSTQEDITNGVENKPVDGKAVKDFFDLQQSSTPANWPRTALQAISQMATRRVSMIRYGDSNEKMDGQGWDWGMGLALKNKYPQFATPVYMSSANITGEGYGTARLGMTGNGTSPTQFDSYKYPSTKNFFYSAIGDLPSTNGVTINTTSGINVNNLLRAHVKYAKFPGAGSWRPGWRREDSPFTALLQYDAIPLSSTTYDVIYETFDLPPATRNFPVAFKYRIPGGGGTAAVSPALFFYTCIEDPSATAGFQTNVMYAAGGQSLYDFAEWNNAQSLEQIGNYYGEVRRMQTIANQKPMIVTYINSGLNDRNETSQPSLGWRSSTAPDSPTAYVDNLEAIISRIETAYQLKGWDESELFFLIIPSHPVSTPDDAKLIAYRKAAQSFATRPRCSFVNIAELITADQILTNGWYKSAGSDRNHLEIAGYNAISELIFNKVPMI